MVESTSLAADGGDASRDGKRPAHAEYTGCALGAGRSPRVRLPGRDSMAFTIWRYYVVTDSPNEPDGAVYCGHRHRTYNGALTCARSMGMECLIGAEGGYEKVTSLDDFIEEKRVGAS